MMLLLSRRRILSATLALRIPSVLHIPGMRVCGNLMLMMVLTTRMTPFRAPVAPTAGFDLKTLGRTWRGLVVGLLDCGCVVDDSGDPSGDCGSVCSAADEA